MKNKRLHCNNCYVLINYIDGLYKRKNKYFCNDLCADQYDKEIK